jgi:acetate kinase
MAPRVLVLNTGSSSLKWSVLEVEHEALESNGDVSWAEGDPTRHGSEIQAALGRLPRVDAVGHRVVHGGARFRAAVRVDERVRRDIAELAELAPLHNPAALAGIDAVTAARPGVPQVAAFDTAFHATLPEAAARYPLPEDWAERWGLRRFGFHGLSVQYAVDRTRALLGTLPRRLVVCHLGAGCSVTAVSDGRSVDTSMGFTPLEGLMMARRSGSVDPGLLLYLLRRRGVDAAELDAALNERSGWLGVSGVSADWRELERAAGTGDRRARLARAMFAHSLARAVGAMLAVLGGLDALVFTGGIGQHSPWLRALVADRLGFAGLRLDAGANEGAHADADVAAPDSRVRLLALEAREDLTILREVRRLLWSERA